MRIKRKGERGSPYLRPVEGLNAFDGQSFTGIEN